MAQTIATETVERYLTLTGMTKEDFKEKHDAIWTGSVWRTQNTGTLAAFNRAMDKAEEAAKWASTPVVLWDGKVASWTKRDGTWYARLDTTVQVPEGEVITVAKVSGERHLYTVNRTIAKSDTSYLYDVTRIYEKDGQQPQKFYEYICGECGASFNGYKCPRCGEDTMIKSVATGKYIM